MHSSWASPDLVYEEATMSFVKDALDPSRSGNFLAAFLLFTKRIAEFGACNTLIQTVLKLTVPGMPDIYQGAELWDLSLIDPDNRRPVDYSLRAQMLEAVSADLARDRRATMHNYAKSWPDGRFKLAAIATILDYRRHHTVLFESGNYWPLKVDGINADQLCAFYRQRDEDVLVTAVTRFPARLAAAGISVDTVVHLPEAPQGVRWYDLLSGLEYAPTACFGARQLFSGLSASVLVPHETMAR